MKVLFVSDGLYIHTGFSVVARNIISRIQDRVEIQYLGTSAAKGPPIPGFENIKEHRPETDKDNMTQLATRVYHQFKPDIVMSISDMWRLPFLASLRASYRFHWIAYQPLDGAPFPSRVAHRGQLIDLDKILARIDTLVPYNEQGREAFSNREVNVLDPIPHGVDSDVFKPIEISDTLRYNLTGFPPTTFVFGYVGLNMKRKGLDKLFEATERVLMTGHNIGLLLHTQPWNIGGWDLVSMAKYYGIQNRVMINETSGPGSGVTSEDLNTMYNCMDAYIMSSRAEGFGLPAAEAMSAGKPILYTNYSGPKYFVKGGGWAIKVASWVINDSTGAKWAVVDYKDLASKMVKLATNKDLASRIGKTGRTIAVKELSWNDIAESWYQLYMKSNTSPIKVTTI